MDSAATASEVGLGKSVTGIASYFPRLERDVTIFRVFRTMQASNKNPDFIGSCHLRAVPVYPILFNSFRLSTDMDPLSITSGVVGLIATTVQMAQAVSALISDIKDAPADVKDLQSDVKSLAALLATTQSLYDTYGRNSVQDAATFGVTLDICLQRCIGPLKELEELLKPFGAGSVKKRSLGRVLSSFTWVMKKGEIKGSKDRLKDAKASLTLTVSVLNGCVKFTERNLSSPCLVIVATSQEGVKNKFNTTSLLATRGSSGISSILNEAGT
jgi:hypothetical protein